MKTSKFGIPDTIFGIDTAMAIVFLPIVIVAVLIVISLNLVIIPKISELKDVNKKLKLLGDQKKSIIEKRDYLLSVDQEEINRNVEFISSAVLPQKNGYMMVGLVSSIANKYGFQVDSFSLTPGEMSKDENTPVTNKTGVAKMPIDLVLVGPVDKYLDMINGIENNLPIMSLDSLKMKNGTGVSKMEVIISAYYVEDKSNFEIGKLTLGDLTLKKEESDLLSKLSTFVIADSLKSLESKVDTNRKYVRYERKDPFNP